MTTQESDGKFPNTKAAEQVSFSGTPEGVIFTTNQDVSTPPIIVGGRRPIIGPHVPSSAEGTTTGDPRLNTSSKSVSTEATVYDLMGMGDIVGPTSFSETQTPDANPTNI